MATVQITVSGTTVGDATRTLTISGAMSDALLAELLDRYGKAEDDTDRTPAEACGAALESYLTSLNNIAARRIEDDRKAAAQAEAAAVITPPQIS